MTTTEQVHTVVIGGGQAGLAVGYHLARRNVPFVILDASHRIGDAWRQRWDSLRLFSIRRYSHLDGMPLPGAGHGFPTKDEIADYLEAYASTFSLPVRNGVRVDRVRRATDRFVVEAGTERIEAHNVVVAMATNQVPSIPAVTAELDGSIRQLHSSRYRNAGELPAGPVLVVGAGNSGCEIALEVAAAGHETVLAGAIEEFVPFRIETIRARFVLLPLLFRVIAHHVVTVRTPIGRRRRSKVLSGRSPLVRVKPKDLVAAGVRRVGPVVDGRDGRPVDSAGEQHDVATVIWCTGFRPDLTWIEVPTAGEHEPEHDRGVVGQVPGLYFVGLSFQYAMSSGFLRGVSRDAEHVARHIAATPAAGRAFDSRPRGLSGAISGHTRLGRTRLALC